MFLWVLICIAFFASELSADEVNTWAFQPGRDTYSDKAVLDLSYLNEDIAGETGFIRRAPDGASFVRGDGGPIRFWAVNSTVARLGLPALREHAKFLAKRGVNMVRFHGQIPQAGKNGGPLESINREERSRIWQMVGAMKQEGIYVTFSPYYPHAVSKEAAQRWVAPHDSLGLTGLIYFDPNLQSAYKSWLRNTLVPVNPFTGLALKDDPALAIIQMQNEDSLLFWTFNKIRGREARMIATRFGEFLTEKYGSVRTARKAWGNVPAPGPLEDMQDDWDNGIIALSNIWHLTAAAGAGSADARLRDQAEFLTITMRRWHQEVARFLREDIGARQLFNAGNWRTADDAVLDDLERYAYTSGEVVAVNRYVSRLHVGDYFGWAISNGDRFRDTGVLKQPLDLPITLRQPANYPYIIPETHWVPPISQQSEAPILMSAYQSLTGVDVSYWYNAGQVQWRQPQSANGHLPSVGKWVINTPQMIGSFPAAAFMFRKGLIEEAQPVIVEHRTLDELWARRRPLTAPRQGQDPNRDSVLPEVNSGVSASQQEQISISPLSFLAGPVHAVFDSNEPDYVYPDLDDFLDIERRVATSITNQLEWDWANGLVTVNAPQAQGVVGALSSRASHDLSDVSIQSSADYASVMVVSMDGAPISKSTKLLIQVGSTARPTGWSTKQVEHEGEPAEMVISFGSAPWQITEIEALLSVKNTILTKATTLDANGVAVEERPVSPYNGVITIKVPKDALYMVLQ
ncbi:MAG: hypothetical protein AAGF53_17090 [Pseudomonadota bacterium]